MANRDNHQATLLRAQALERELAKTKDALAERERALAEYTVSAAQREAATTSREAASADRLAAAVDEGPDPRVCRRAAERPRHVAESGRCFPRAI